MVAICCQKASTIPLSPCLPWHGMQPFGAVDRDASSYGDLSYHTIEIFICCMSKHIAGLTQLVLPRPSSSKVYLAETERLLSESEYPRSEFNFC